MTEHFADRMIRMSRVAHEVTGSVINAEARREKRRMRKMVVPDHGDDIMMQKQRYRAERERYIRSHLSPETAAKRKDG